MIKSFDEAVPVLRERFPQFQKYAGNDDRMSFDTDDPYLVFGDFAIFLKEKIDELDRRAIQRDNEDLVKGFGLIGELIESSRPDLLQLVEVGIIEIVENNRLACEVARDQLRPRTFQTYVSLMKR